jgi:hypothetical protein
VAGIRATELRANNSVVILGPMGVGKSSLARLLAPRLNMPRCCIDDVQWGYLPDFGFDHHKAKTLLRSDPSEFFKYSSPFMLLVVERALSEHPNHVIDFGAGHAAYDEPDLARRLKSALAPIRNVLLLMPSPDLKHCLGTLPGPSAGMMMNPVFIQHPLKDEVAKHVVHTKGKTPEEIANEALEWIDL